MSEIVTTIGYLTVEPILNAHGTVTGAKFVEVTQSKPHMENNQRAIRLQLTLPKEAFYPITDVAVKVPASLVVAPEVTVEAIP